VRKFRGDVLDLDRIHNHANFIDFGGHSLTATRVSPRLLKEFPSVISPQFISGSRTADEIATVIAAHRETNQQRGVEASVDRNWSHVKSRSEEAFRDCHTGKTSESVT
jgi:hypothetical protein